MTHKRKFLILATLVLASGLAVLYLVDRVNGLRLNVYEYIFQISPGATHIARSPKQINDITAQAFLQPGAIAAFSTEFSRDPTPEFTKWALIFLKESVPKKIELS